MDKKQIQQKFGDVIRRIRYDQSNSEVKLSQSDLATDADISTKYYCDLENGKRMPSLEVMWKIATAFGLKLSELCERIENY